MKQNQPFARIVILTLVLGSIETILGVSQKMQNEPTNKSEGIKEAIAYSNKMVAITHDWILGKHSSPGSRVSLQEIDRVRMPAATTVTYHMFVHGVPLDQNYTEVNWPVTLAAPVEGLRGLTLAPDGLVICSGLKPGQCASPEKKNDPVAFTFSALKGEIFRMGLVSEDQRTSVYFAVVPDPIESKNGSCTLRAYRIQPEFQTAMIWGRGFSSHETLNFYSKSFGEEHLWQVSADSNGDFVTALLPFVSGKQNGNTVVTLTGKKCAPSLSFKWGD